MNTPLDKNGSAQPGKARKHSSRRAKALAGVSAVALLMTSLAHAQTPPSSETAMVRLIRGLIESGALKKDVGDALLAQAQTEAIAAQQVQRQAAAAPATAAASGRNKIEPGDVRVPYISASVRDQIRDEVKGEIMAQAKSEGWAAPNETPEWTKRIRIEGDMRVRGESRFYSGNNSNIETDWRNINSGSGYDVNPNTNLALPQLLNTRQDRANQLRIRARLGIFADISDSTQAGLRLASGSDDSPVSTTQTLGGGLNKKNIWLDQAWMSYKFNDMLKVTGGRFGNPFFSTEMLFSNDLNFDGLVAQFDKTLANKDLSVFGTLGLIPLEYSSDSSPGRSQNKLSSQNKWLIGAQVGAQWKLDAENRLRGAVAYYDFKNITGRVSDSCALYAGADGCNTDWSRPAFMQRGNTLMLLRNIALDPTNPANTPQPQYVGLASKFQLLDLNARWDTRIAGGYGFRLDGNFIRNLAYDENEMFRRATVGIVNNGGTAQPGVRGDFKSGANAYMMQATLGNPNPAAVGEWNVLAGYRRIEPDALPDAYNDSTFHQGGTNAKGYYLGGSYAFDKNTLFSGRWYATKSVYGAPVAIDTLQLELNTRF
ncbi:putative porin [Herbaspirillum chlorophenolicum]|uniref:putative porin n=1 Tax=Herbaspirillum chlorophenolicum TaxID=211589 RepID=UPI000A77DF9D|nr:putative porin [Herbaspirillum chlorophenolicum]